MYGLELVAAPADLPVTLGELERWLRLEPGDQSEQALALGAAAVRAVERLAGRQLMPATWRLTLDGFPFPRGWELVASPRAQGDVYAVRLPRAPLRSITSVEYYDLAGTLQVLAASRYDVDVTTDPGRLALAYNQTWPVTRPMPGAVRVTFEAGYSGLAAVPANYRTAALMLAAYWYENRGDGAEDRRVPGPVKALLDSETNGETEYGL